MSVLNPTIWKVINRSARIYKNCTDTDNDKAAGYAKYDTRITEQERLEMEVNGELKVIRVRGLQGWFNATDLQLVKEGAGNITKPGPIKDIIENSPPPTKEELNELGQTEEGDDEEGSGYQPSTEDALSYRNDAIEDSDFANIKSIMGVFGLPYQFLPNTDPRLVDSTNVQNIGYEYAEKIIERIPLLFIAPGKANFMTRYSKKNKESILNKIIDMGTNNNNNQSINDLLDADGRYYTFEYDPVRYYKFVNPACRIAARYLNLQDKQINGVPLDRLNWEDFTKSGIKSVGDFGSYTSVPFYVDSNTSISENFSNSTSQSMLASAVNSVSDMGKELAFLLGSSATATGVEALAVDADMATNIENVQNTINSLLSKGHFANNLVSHLGTVVTGGRMMFPEIWADSSFSRSYTCSLKFISPDPSSLSVYLNVIVPLLHLLALVAPQSVSSDPNFYSTPFLVRACYKGFFNIDTGIITSMSVTKGAECQWTPEGIPTSINVDIDIKDLYNAMSVTSTESKEWKYDTLNNTALMDYIANLCGINIFKPEITRIIEMWWVNNFEGRLKDFFKVDIWGGIQQKVQNLIMSVFR